MPWDLIPGFNLMNPDIITVERRGRRDTKVWINLPTIAKRLKAWRFPLAGFVGYERCVVTAGGVDTDEIIAKTMASRLVEGLYFCGPCIFAESCWISMPIREATIFRVRSVQGLLQAGIPPSFYPKTVWDKIGFILNWSLFLPVSSQNQGFHN